MDEDVDVFSVIIMRAPRETAHKDYYKIQEGHVSGVARWAFGKRLSQPAGDKAKSAEGGA